MRNPDTTKAAWNNALEFFDGGMGPTPDINYAFVKAVEIPTVREDATYAFNFS